MTSTVLILGAGTMGAGIAQIAAMHGWNVLLRDVDVATAQRGIEGIRAQLDRLVVKGKITGPARDEALARLQACDVHTDLSYASLVIEAIVENIDIKSRVLRELLMHVNDDCIIATNTSSLSVSAIGEAIEQPQRTVGMHFFNPAPIMKLVEVIAGVHTSPAIVDRVEAIAQSWGKTTARCADVPGFIVNHVARPYYLEAFRIVEDGFAPPDVIDNAMKTIGGFRMGPFELTDLIGQDVNTATSRSVWEQLGKPPLLKPSALQESLVSAGHLGRKTKRGVYDYSGESPVMAIEALTPSDGLVTQSNVASAVDAFVVAAVDGGKDASPVERYVFARILAALIAQAHIAHERGVATADAIDTAMKFGVNYPKGPFEWTQQISPGTVCNLLESLNASVDDDRFAEPANLRERVA